MSEEFDWDGYGRSSIIQQPVKRVAAYRNVHGDIAVREECDFYSEHDHFIVIAHGRAIATAYAILEAAGLPMEIVEVGPDG